MIIETHRQEETLIVSPSLVYGTPPTARVEGERLVSLGRQTVPLRNAAVERQLTRQLELELGLEPGRSERFTGEDAVRFVRRLQTWRGEVHGDGHQAFVLAPALVPRVQLERAHFAVFFDTSDVSTARHATSTRAEAGAVLRAWQRGATFVPLTDGSGWAPCQSTGSNVSATALPISWQHAAPQERSQPAPYQISHDSVSIWNSHRHPIAPIFRHCRRTLPGCLK